MIERRFVEVYWSLDNEYYAFLKQNSPDEEMKRGLGINILGTYEISGLEQFSKILDVCDSLKTRQREEVKNENKIR